MDNIKNLNIPQNSILGINYSGMHDSSIAIVSPTGEVIYAISLERVSRRKQDGRFPTKLLENLPWDKISKVALSNCEEYTEAEDNTSELHPIKLPKDIIADRSHAKIYYDQIENIKKEKQFFPHHLCHASSSFYGSGFEDAICLVYDGGMYNEHWFGGVYIASKEKGIEPFDLFSTQSYSNITHLYTYITALLGFTPLKHEGKITGLAAYGEVTDPIRTKLTNWLNDPAKMKGIYYWANTYSNDKAPQITVDPKALKEVQQEIEEFKKEDLAATVQFLAEEHVLQILKNLQSKDLGINNICLSGGLFANVKINQRISEFGFENIFVAPPMTDDGTALGAAWLALSDDAKREIAPIKNVYLGDQGTIEEFLNTTTDIVYHKYENTEEFLAQKLSQGLVCAIFQGSTEFGPRALCNRSIVAQATQYEINNGLNNRLNRTEFMPFAPVIRDIDLDEYFILKEGEQFTAKFMTITANCTDKAQENCPAVVHVDKTARPQIVEQKDNPFMYELLTEYVKQTDKHALVNTSFNIHEEPIVNTYYDAIKGFFEAKLDYLYLDGIVISLEENPLYEKKYQK